MLETPATENAAPDAAAAHPCPDVSHTSTQIGPKGIRFDFKERRRVLSPPREHGKWRALPHDLVCGNILYQAENKDGLILSSKRWRVRFGVEVWSSEKGSSVAQRVRSQVYEAAEHDVTMNYPVGALGTSIAWFSYASRSCERQHSPGAGTPRRLERARLVTSAHANRVIEKRRG